MSLLASIRSRRAADPLALNNGTMIVRGDMAFEAMSGGAKPTMKLFFDLGNGQVLSEAAIVNAEKAGKVKVEWEPKDSKKNPLDEIHITMVGGNLPIPTDTGYVGFGETGQGKTAADLLASRNAAPAKTGKK
jgi:hypothetical protein